MYTIKQAAARAGVTPTVARAWERRYGIVRPTRTASGYRLYDDEAIERLGRMRALTERGWTASEAARAVLSGEAAAMPARIGPRGFEAPSADGLISNFVLAAVALDGPAVEAALDEMLSRGSFEAVVDTHLMPAAAALGDAWAEGRLSVGGEHAASGAIERRLAAAFQAASFVDGPPVVVGLPPGSRHELGALAYATALRRRGVPVLYLGADVPVASWIYAAERLQPTLAVIGVVTEDDVRSAREVVEALTQPPATLPVVFGGKAAEQVAASTVAAHRLPEPIVAAVVETLALLGAH